MRKIVNAIFILAALFVAGVVYFTTKYFGFNWVLILAWIGGICLVIIYVVLYKVAMFAVADRQVRGEPR